MAEDDQRNSLGQFKKGHRKLGGNVANAEGQVYLESFTKVIDLEKFEALLQKTYDFAMLGHARARDRIFEYIIGKPVQILPVQMNDNPMMRLLEKWRAEDEAKAKAKAKATESEPADAESGA